MTDFTSMLTYTADKFTPTGFLCYYKEKVDAETPTMMPANLLQKLYNLRRYITHVMNESDYDPDDPDFDHPLSDEPVYLYSLFYFYMVLVIASLANLHTHAFPIQGTLYIKS